MPHRSALLALAAALLALVTAACSQAEGEAMRAGVRIEDFAYQPATMSIESGTAVTFTNRDGFAHTVTARDGSFASQNLDDGATFTHTFATPGTFEFFCAIHNSMTGTVVVE